MKFSPAFYLLSKFSIGLRDVPKSEDDMATVANYLGVEIPNTTLDDKIKVLAEELQSQNGFLSNEIGSAAISGSVNYARSLFIREVVANNRINIEDRRKREG